MRWMVTQDSYAANHLLLKWGRFYTSLANNRKQ